MTRPAPTGRLGAPRARRATALHVHWFRRIGDDAFSGSSLYACRCGQVRAAI